MKKKNIDNKNQWTKRSINFPSQEKNPRCTATILLPQGWWQFLLLPFQCLTFSVKFSVGIHITAILIAGCCIPPISCLTITLCELKQKYFFCRLPIPCSCPSLNVPPSSMLSQVSFPESTKRKSIPIRHSLLVLFEKTSLLPYSLLTFEKEKEWRLLESSVKSKGVFFT